MPNNLGETIREERLAKGLSQRELAELSLISRAHISKIERNKIERIHFYTLNALAECLDLDIKVEKDSKEESTENCKENEKKQNEESYSVGEYIRKNRIEKGLSQSELAKLIGISKGMIGKIERGQSKKLRFGTLRKVQKYFGLDFEDLLTQCGYYEKEQNEENYSLGEYIRRSRIAKGLTQYKLSKLIGDSNPNRIKNIEAGKAKKISDFTLELLAKQLDLNLEELVRLRDKDKETL